MVKYILAIDQSTTATKAILFNENADLVNRFDKKHKQIHSNPGWVEHDPNEIYRNTISSIQDVIDKAGIYKEDIAALAITNQRETTLLWDENGEPVYNAVVWQCSRAEYITRRPEIQSEEEYIENATGLKLSPYFSAAKARWIYENIEPKSALYFGTIDSWLIFKLTGNHATDYSNASRTQLFNINTLQWDERLLKDFGLSHLVMPNVQESDSIFGYTTVEGLFDKPIPLVGVMGDSQAALFGQQCWSKGTGKVTFGTGSSVMLNIGEKVQLSLKGLATSIAWRVNGKTEYVFEGNINCSGDTIKWMVNELQVLPDAGMAEDYANKVPSSQGVYIIPAFVGLGAPYWKSDARALIYGLFRNANKYHIVRAGLESMAYQVKDIVDIMIEESQIQLSELKVDGGPTNNGFLMQFVADILNTTIVKNELEELSALGVAYAAGLGTGIWKDEDQLSGLRKASKHYKRLMPEKEIESLCGGWKKALNLLI